MHQTLSLSTSQLLLNSIMSGGVSVTQEARSKPGGKQKGILGTLVEGSRKCSLPHFTLKDLFSLSLCHLDILVLGMRRDVQFCFFSNRDNSETKGGTECVCLRPQFESCQVVWGFLGRQRLSTGR